MPNRILKESICVSDSIDGLGWFEEVLFYRLIVNCDDYGRFDGRPAIIKNRLFPLKENLTVKTVSGAINKLVSAGLVTLYVFEGKPYLYLPTWNHHQSVRAKRSKYPAPESDCMSSEEHESICKQMISDDCKCSRNPIQSESISESESESESDAGARVKHKHGQYGNVLLTDEDLGKLKTEFPVDWSDRIERLSEYMASTGKSYKNHLATIRNWARKDAQKPKQDNGFKTGNPFLEMLEEERRR